MRDLVKDSRPGIFREQFIPDHLFIFVVKGAISLYDGSKNYTLKAGECCIARKNRLIKYVDLSTNQELHPVLFCFDKPFLQDFEKKHNTKSVDFKSTDAIIKIKHNELMNNFISSLKPYYKGVMQLVPEFEDLKYEELIIILLKKQPELAGIFFDYGIPQKIDLEAYMNKNFHFNISMQRFAYMTGRSLASFKRDFKQVFNDSPNHWLVQKRLNEAYFLIKKKSKKPSEIYLELGFEDLSHFSFAFKKQFGITPTSLATAR